MFTVGNDELEQAPTLRDEPFPCYRCGDLHPIIDSQPPGVLQAVRCGDGMFLVGIKWRRITPPRDKQ